MHLIHNGIFFNDFILVKNLGLKDALGLIIILPFKMNGNTDLPRLKVGVTS